MKRNKFSLSNEKLLSCRMGKLVPIGLTEVLPGDSFQHNTSIFARVTPLVTPVMHTVHMRIHHFFVPTRLVWDNWQNFITGGPDGMNASSPPSILAPVPEGYPIGSLMDYMGVTPQTGGYAVSAIPIRMYNLIFNEYFRDEDLVAPLPVPKTDGPDSTSPVICQNIAWEKDYFTSARPWAQKGPEISIPMAASAPVVSNGNVPTFNGGGATNGVLATDISPPAHLYVNGAVSNAQMTFGNESGLETDLTDAAGSLLDLREAYALLRYQEARARYGSRYTEYLAYLGVRSSDARLQRPEYLGGGSSVLQFSEVLQTTPESVDGSSDEQVGVGELKGHGIGAMRSNRYRRFFEEHGYVITLLSVRPKTVYTQGIPRTFFRQTKEDYWQRELEHIGQQEILKGEIYAAAGTDATEGWGAWQNRYEEYRRQENTVAGQFRTTLKDWHMAREFAAEPVLNGAFVTCDPTDRIYAVPGTPEEPEDQLYIKAMHSIQARRLVSGNTGSWII